MKMYIGENIAEQRKKAHMTQEELAQRLNVTNKAIWSWEHNRTEPKADVVQKMMNVFDCSIVDLTKQINVDLSYEEYMLIERFRSMSTPLKTRLAEYYEFLTEMEKKGNRKK